MKPTSYTVIDFETTGLNPEVDRILEIGVCVVRSGREPLALSLMVNPGIEVPEVITRITGITQKDIDGEHDTAYGLNWMRSLGLGDVIVGHNIIAFDKPFLEAECRRAGLASLLAGRTIIDTAAIFLGHDQCIAPYVGETPEEYAARVVPTGYYNHRKYNLGHCAKTLGVSLDGIQLHRAAGDVLLTHRVFDAIPEMVEVERPRAAAVML